LGGPLHPAAELLLNVIIAFAFERSCCDAREQRAMAIIGWKAGLVQNGKQGKVRKKLHARLVPRY